MAKDTGCVTEKENVERLKKLQKDIKKGDRFDNFLANINIFCLIEFHFIVKYIIHVNLTIPK